MNYYGVNTPTDHLAHYGVKGMKWGVRRAIATGNQAALDRHYRKAARKLAKLQNIGNNPIKSAAKAGVYGAAATAAGMTALGGTNFIGKSMRYGAAGLRTLNAKLGKAPPGVKRFTRIDDAAKKVEEWGNKNRKIKIDRPIIDEQTGQLTRKTIFEKNPTNNKLLRLGAAAAAAGLAAKAYQHGRRAKNAEMYREKAQRWKEAMDETFANTRYEGQYAKVRRRTQRMNRRYGG